MLLIDSRYFYYCGCICGMLEGSRAHEYLTLDVLLSYVTSRRMNLFLGTLDLLSLAGERQHISLPKLL